MNEAAWCYLEGFGCKKDKVSTSQPFPCVFLVANQASLYMMAFAIFGNMPACMCGV